MIDLKQLRENPQKYIDGATNKGVKLDRDAFLDLDKSVRALQASVDELKAKKNKLSQEVSQSEKGSDAFQALVAQVQEIKWSLTELEGEYDEKHAAFLKLLYQIPNPAFDEVKVAASDDENYVLEEVWTKPNFDFEPKPHRELLEAKGLIDQERAVKLSWARFQIIRGQFAQLQFALMNRVMTKLVNKWFNLTLVPQLVKEDALFATWYLPNDSTNLYRVNPKLDWHEQSEREEDDLWLIWTAEVPLISQHAGETFESDQLPLRYVWFSSCFRREAWSYGKDTKWLIRLHQFDKVEMVSFVQGEDAAKEHELLREIEEEIFSELWIPFVRLWIVTGDLGAPAAKKYDLEARFPGIWSYKEVTSTSNTTDFQTRRANIKVSTTDGKEFAHSLNGTAVALWRALAAIVENYQTADGDIMVPEVLKSLVSFDKF